MATILLEGVLNKADGQCSRGQST